MTIRTRVRYRRSVDLVQLITDTMRAATTAQREHFLAQVESEIVSYLSFAPRYEAFSKISAELEKLDGAARAFASAVAALNPETITYLKQGLFMNAHRRGEDGRAYAAASAATLIRSGEAAKETAATAARLLRGMKNKPTIKKAEAQFVVAVARAYGSAFGERASHSKTGLFARLLPPILKEAAIGGPIAEARLNTILKGEILTGQAPKRGPKPARLN
jgi:hypothetical protein